MAVPDQTTPVRVTLRAQLTTSDLVLAPAALDFGEVPQGEAAALELVLTNPSRLPQRYSFGRPTAGASAASGVGTGWQIDGAGAGMRPPGVTVSPSDGFGTIQPGRSVALTVGYRPAIPGPQHFTLRCATEAGRVFSVHGRAVGVEPPVRLSHNAIKVGAPARWQKGVDSRGVARPFLCPNSSVPN